MEISRKLELIEPPLSQEQRDILAYDDGPLLIIAGPGSGKTYSLIFRAMNILLHQKAKPSELILCTYTDKAANEMRSRFMKLAQDVGYEEDLSRLRVGTIHSICNQLITEYRHLTPLGNDYTVLDDFAQRFFIFRHLQVIDQGNYFSNLWGISKWEIAKQLQQYFDKIMEELIDYKKLESEADQLLSCLGYAYSRYSTLLTKQNSISYAAQLKIAYDLLYKSDKADTIVQKFRYVFVDEYQDTNHIQEQIVRKLASSMRNLCVVGDEDQGVYRFRGATVRNILEFKQNVSDCQELYLTTNYRSHKTIISRCNEWMRSHNWQNDNITQPLFRRDKTITYAKEKVYLDHPAIICIEEQNAEEEARQFAELVFFLKDQHIIDDYSEIALLLESVKSIHSDVYKKALKEKSIDTFCPRARSFFSHEEIRLLIAFFAHFFNYDENDFEPDLLHDTDFTKYIQQECIKLSNDTCDITHPLHSLLQIFHNEFLLEEPPQDTLMDYYYRILATEPFISFVQDKQKMHNLVIFSKHLQTFQGFYKYACVTEETYPEIRHNFFSIFLCLLQAEGVNEYEDTEQPFPKGCVQILTIHQAKGLEFPVVAVGSLSKKRTGSQKIDRVLEKFYGRKKFEEENRIRGFDLMRLYYVAFSRAENLLILTSNRDKPRENIFEPIARDLPRWPIVKNKVLSLPQTQIKKPLLVKQHYSFTGHIQVYETCTRKYQYFREFGFVSARQKEVFLGLLVHNTLEEVHREAKKGMIASLNKDKVQKRQSTNSHR